MLIVDAHLDLAYNALRGREVLRPADQQIPDDEGIPSVGLPDLHAGSVRLICATIFVEPSSKGGTGYTSAGEADAAGRRQLDWYIAQERAGAICLVRSAADLSIDVVQGGPLSAVMLLEGADPIRTPADAATWFAMGIRIVGLAWKQTRYAGGTGAPGPLTADGFTLVRELDKVRMIHDASHLAEESFWQLLDLSTGPVIASHSNCRSIVPTDRQLSDDMIRAIVKRGGVIGINFFDKFLLRPEIYKTRRATLADVVDHMKHVCDLAGSARHVAIGTDMDGGLGRDQIPQEITTSADLPKLIDALNASGFADGDISGILGGNWIRYFRRNLPA